MGFFDRIFSGKKVFPGKNQPLYIVELTVGGKKYILDQFSMGLEQDVDSKHRPCSEVYGGIMQFSTSDPLDLMLNDWVINNKKMLDGEVKIFDNTDKLMQGAQTTIIFERAYCIQMKKESGRDGQVVSSFTISPAIIKIENEVIELRKD